MAAGGEHHRDAESGQTVDHVLHGGVAVDLVVEVQGLAEPHGDRLEVAAGKTAIGRKALAEDAEVAELLGPVVIPADQEAADVGETVLLAAHGGAVGEREHFLRDLHQRPVGVAVLALRARSRRSRRIGRRR